MDISVLLGLMGGLALFLYGMQMMSSGLEAAAGAKMTLIMERITANRLLGVAVGAAITAVIQSSSATTVMVVGFVNARMMTLHQAVWIIMGANIGTTITGQLIGLGVGEMAPIFDFVGVAMIMFMKSPRIHHIGQILAGLGVLFIGMDMMSGAMVPLRESEAFVSMLSQFTNPLMGILVGALFTAVIQSSSASVGILQALVATGVLGFDSAVFILFGQNIGTCITAVLAAIGTSRGAKRATIIHLMFNIIGTTIFSIICILFPLPEFIASFTPDNPQVQIANMHTFFNIATTLMLLPLGNYMATVATRILPELPEENSDEMHTQHLTSAQFSTRDGGLGASAIYVGELQMELNRMLSMARDNVDMSFLAVMKNDTEKLKEVTQVEDYIDFLNKEISRHISRLIAYETNEQSSAIISSYFTITGNVERIGDHAINICGYTKMLKKRGIHFSDGALGELEEMRTIILESVDTLLGDRHSIEWLAEVAALEQRTDDMTKQFRRRHLDRMRAGKCSDEACIIFAELLTDFERLGDHALNIAQEMAYIQAHS